MRIFAGVLRGVKYNTCYRIPASKLSTRTSAVL